jgi:hypothetical protein
MRVIISAINFSILQWIGVRLCRDEDPGRVRIVARRSLTRAETIANEDVDLSDPRPIWLWSLERWAWPMTGWWSPIRTIPRPGRIALSALALWACAALLVLGMIVVRDRGNPEEDGAAGDKITLGLTRHLGDAARRSRCGECAQPGDEFVAAAEVRDPSGGARGIRVYLDQVAVASCADCSSLSFRISSPGRYVVVAVRIASGRPCLIDGATGLDGDLASIAQCGARVATSEVEAR